jgi:hypothetical protein
MAALSIAESAPQRADLDLQIGLFDERLRPRSGNQLLLGDNLTRALDKSRQDIEGPAAEPHRLIAFKEKALRCKQPERAKREGVLAARCR